MRTIVRAALAAALLLPLPALAATYDLVVDRTDVVIEGQTRRVFSINGQIAGPTLRWKEGEEVTINVTNRLKEETSIHWHGVLLPYQMDGVPMVSFAGIKPGATFTYRFRTWYAPLAKAVDDATGELVNKRIDATAVSSTSTVGWLRLAQ